MPAFILRARRAAESVTRVAIVFALLFVILVASPAYAATDIDTSRVVSIGGAVTEILYALGLEKKIVGVDTTSLYPSDVLSTLPNVGYMRALSAEGILSLHPSAVLAVDGSGPADVLKLVADAGVPIITIADDPSAAGIAAKVKMIGKLMGEADAADALANQIEQRFSLLAAMREKIKQPVRVLFILSLQGGKPLVGGSGSSADAIIKLAGAVNAASVISGYKQMTDEAIVAAAPDVILAMPNGNLVGSSDEIFALPAFATTPAAAKHALVTMDGLYLLGFGPRTPDAARDLMHALYPDLVLPALPMQAQRG